MKKETKRIIRNWKKQIETDIEEMCKEILEEEKK